MPRPTKCRRICELPRRERFGPLDGPPEDAVEMTVDEYEVIRLIDLVGRDNYRLLLDTGNVA